MAIRTHRQTVVPIRQTPMVNGRRTPLHKIHSAHVTRLISFKRRFFHNVARVTQKGRLNRIHRIVFNVFRINISLKNI